MEQIIVDKQRLDKLEASCKEVIKIGDIKQSQGYVSYYEKSKRKQK